MKTTTIQTLEHLRANLTSEDDREAIAEAMIALRNVGAEQWSERDYWESVRSLAIDAFEATIEESEDQIGEYVDGCGWVIYYHAARKVLEYSRNEDEIFEVGLGLDAFDSIGSFHCAAAFWAMCADVREAIEDVDPIESEAVAELVRTAIVSGRCETPEEIAEYVEDEIESAGIYRTIYTEEIEAIFEAKAKIAREQWAAHCFAGRPVDRDWIDAIATIDPIAVGACVVDSANGIYAAQIAAERFEALIGDSDLVARLKAGPHSDDYHEATIDLENLELESIGGRFEFGESGDLFLVPIPR